MTDTKHTLASPCVRNCCLNNDDVCLGCFRHIDEILVWQQSSTQQKQQILVNCQQRKTTSGNN